jgi:uncharacterized protein (TIGR02118 family)
MAKLIAFFKRKAELSAEDFQQHWRTQHAALVARQAGLRRYVQNHTLLSAYRTREPAYDGVAEAWFDSRESFAELTASPEWRAVREDEAHFIDPQSLQAVMTDEVVIVDGPVPDPAVKMISFLNKRSDVSVEFFQNHWRDKHGPIAAEIPGNQRYVQCHVQAASYRGDHKPVYDGIPISWFADTAALRASAQTPQYKATRADEVHFMASSTLPFVIATALEIELAR